MLFKKGKKFKAMFSKGKSIGQAFYKGSLVFSKGSISYGTLTYIDAGGLEKKFEVKLLNDWNRLMNSNVYTTPIIFEDGTTIIKDKIIGWAFNTTDKSLVPQSIGAYFLRSCPSLNSEIIIPKQITSIGDAFLGDATSFNSPVFLGENLLTIGEGFLNRATLMNSQIIFGNKLSSIGASFLQGSHNFNQPINLPPSLKTIGNSFMSYNYLGETMNFNSPINLEYVESIGASFMFQSKFNKPITLTSIKNIGDNFLYGCSLFNSAISIGNLITNISNGFLNSCTIFNQAIALPQLTSIGNDFLYDCRNFNQAITLPVSLVSLGTGFLKVCSLFNKPITIPESITAIKSSFLEECNAFNSAITLSSTLESIDSGFLRSCKGYNQPIVLPSSLKTIGSTFLYNAEIFDSTIIIPNSLVSIGDYFLNNCFAYNKEIIFPVSLTSVGSSCMGETRNMISKITFFCPASIFTASVDSFSGYQGFTPLATIGKFADGPYNYDIIAKFPNRISSPYRKWTNPPLGAYGTITYLNAQGVVAYLPIDLQADWDLLFSGSASPSSSIIAFSGASIAKDKITGFDFNNTVESAVPQSINANFMTNFISLNKRLVIPNQITSIGASFLEVNPQMETTASFNSDIVFSTALISIGDNFLYGQKAFNKPLTMPSSLNSIGNDFLAGFRYGGDVQNFNSTVILSNVSSIGNNFLLNTKFNKPIDLTLVSNIGDLFLARTIFNNIITFGSSVEKTIGNEFLSECTVFNQSITLPTNIVFGSRFMHRCEAFNKALIVTSGSYFGADFLLNCNNMGATITINANPSTNFVSDSNPTVPSTLAVNEVYLKAIGINGAYGSEFMSMFPNLFNQLGMCRQLISVA